MRLHRDAHQVFQQPGNMRGPPGGNSGGAPARDTPPVRCWSSRARWPLVVEADTSATVLSSVAVHARPSISAQRILTLDESEEGGGHHRHSCFQRLLWLTVLLRFQEIHSESMAHFLVTSAARASSSVRRMSRLRWSLYCTRILIPLWARVSAMSPSSPGRS